MESEKICKKCGRLLPIEKFRLKSGINEYKYYSGQCKDCEREYENQYKKNKREKEYTFSDNLEIIIQRKYKKIHPARILDISKTGLNIGLLGTDEMFVKLMDYRDTWLSNYGRVVRYSDNKHYNLLAGSYRNDELCYTLPKNMFINGKWVYKSVRMYAPKAVIETFIVNEDKANNIFIWHKEYDKKNCYYKNLYPLNQAQYRIVKNHYIQTGDDSEEFILKVMNDIRYKPDDWSKEKIKPVMYGIGYHGLLYTNHNEESYKRWHYIMNRCYSKAIHDSFPNYDGCTVCEEWHNYSNFKLWYDEHIAEINCFDEIFEIDKDILIKGNMVYSPETVCFVPKIINGLFSNYKSNNEDCPIGIYFETDSKKFRACMTLMGKNIKLGRFDTEEEAFARYKEYKESFIKKMANQYRSKIPDKVYQAMMNWKVEITD